MKIKMKDIYPNPDQPRKMLDEGALEALAESIRTYGLLNPIAVSHHPEHEGQFLIIDGERRWRACRRAGMKEIEANIVHANDIRLRATLANTQRADLNPIEEAQAFRDLRGSKFTLADISRAVGRSVAHIQNRLAMLEIDEGVQVLVASGELPSTPEAIRAIMELPQALRVRYATSFARRGLSVRMIVRMCQRICENQVWEQEIQTREDVKADDPHPESQVEAREVSGDEKSELPEMPGAMTGQARQKSPGTKTAVHYRPAPLKRISKSFDLVEIFRILKPSDITWEGTCEAARAACRKCVLYDDAGPRNCRDCSLVIALQKIGG